MSVKLHVKDDGTAQHPLSGQPLSEVHFLDADGLLVLKVPGHRHRSATGPPEHEGTKYQLWQITAVPERTVAGWLVPVRLRCEFALRPPGTPAQRVESMRAVRSRLQRRQDPRVYDQEREQ